MNVVLKSDCRAYFGPAMFIPRAYLNSTFNRAQLYIIPTKRLYMLWILWKLKQNHSSFYLCLRIYTNKTDKHAYTTYIQPIMTTNTCPSIKQFGNWKFNLSSCFWEGAANCWRLLTRQNGGDSVN